jgi:hypothetical protein
LRILFPLTVVIIICFLSDGFSVPAQDRPGGRSHGPLPAVNREILAALDSAAPELKQKVVVVSSRAACPPGPKVILESTDKTIGDYFARYYRDDDLRVSLSGRLTIGPNLVGYLIEAPGMYDLSVIDLWTYDARHNSWLQPMELSENWGDAGDYYYSDSLLVDVDGDGYKDIVKRAKNGRHDMDADQPARIFFDYTILRKLVDGTFHNFGAPPKFLNDRLLALEKKLDCE